MGTRTEIEWTDATWNPITGCTQVSPGCDNCYALTLAERFRGTSGHYYEDGFDVQLRPDKLDQPLRWRKPRRVFVNSMSDLFHADVPDEYIARVWAVMALAPQHTFQILTKRHARMRSLLRRDQFCWLVWDAMRAINWERIVAAPGPHAFPSSLAWPLPNAWLGVSVEDQKWADTRIPALLDTPAAVRFLSCEPLLGPVSLDRIRPHIKGNCHRVHHHGLIPLLDIHGAVREPAIDWVIVGGESGRAARPMHPGWVRSLRDQCVNAGVPYFFKQWGAYGPANSTDDPDRVIRLGKRKSGRLLDGRTWDEFPPCD